MAPQVGIFATPGVEEMTESVTQVVGASITGVVEGIIVKMAPQMGAAAPILTWGTLLGTPLAGVGLSLITRGLLGDLAKGVASGSSAILGYTLPSLLAPELFGRKRTQMTAEQRAALAAGRDVKQLGAGALNAPQRAQDAARSVSVLEI